MNQDGKNKRNARIVRRLDSLMSQAKHGFYESVFQVVREEVEIEREVCAKICEERQFGIGCSHAFEAAQRIRGRGKP